MATLRAAVASAPSSCPAGCCARASAGGPSGTPSRSALASPDPARTVDPSPASRRGSTASGRTYILQREATTNRRHVGDDVGDDVGDTLDWWQVALYTRGGGGGGRGGGGGGRVGGGEGGGGGRGMQPTS